MKSWTLVMVVVATLFAAGCSGEGLDDDEVRRDTTENGVKKLCAYMFTADPPVFEGVGQIVTYCISFNCIKPATCPLNRHGGISPVGGVDVTWVPTGQVVNGMVAATAHNCLKNCKYLGNQRYRGADDGMVISELDLMPR